MTDRTHPDSGRATGGIVEMLQDRIAELEAQLESAGFTPADMATAAAQGFRDGVASCAAIVGSEPVALIEHTLGGSIQYCPLADAAYRLPMGVEFKLYTHPSPPEGMVGGWMPIETAPKNGRTLLLGYFNSAGKWRTTRGQWMSQDYIDEYAEDPDFMSPGWHETTVEDDDGKCWPINPTHWIPTPPPPTSSADSGNGE